MPQLCHGCGRHLFAWASSNVCSKCVRQVVTTKKEYRKQAVCKVCGIDRYWKNGRTCPKCEYAVDREHQLARARRRRSSATPRICPDCTLRPCAFNKKRCDPCSDRAILVRRKASNLRRRNKIYAYLSHYRKTSPKWRARHKHQYVLKRVLQLKPLFLDPVSHQSGPEFKIKRFPKAQAWQLRSPEERETRRLEAERCRNQRKNARRVNAPGRIKKGDIAWLFQAQKGRCFYCTHKLPKKYHIDHFIPLAAGGTNYRDNLRLACPRCNLAKAAKLPEQFMGLMIA